MDEKRGPRFRVEYLKDDLTCTCNLFSWGHEFILSGGMTALITILDGPSQEIVIFSDGLASSRDGKIRYMDEIKTNRLNDNCVVGHAGDVSFGEHIIAQLFGRNDLLHERFRFQVMRLIEEKGFTRPELNYQAARQIITERIQQALQDIAESHAETPKGNLILAAVDSGFLKCCCWSYKAQWKDNELVVDTTGIQSRVISPVPCTDPLATHIALILDNKSITIEERAIEVIEDIALAFPDEVNNHASAIKHVRS